MSNRVFQGIVLQMKEASDRVIGVLDGSGTVVACTELARIGERWDNAASEIELQSDETVRCMGYTFKTLAGWSAHFDFAAFVQGEDNAARGLSVMATIALNSAKASYDEKHDKATFVKNILLGNVLPGDIYVRSRELHFESAAPRAVLLVRQIDNNDIAAVDVVQGLFPDRQHDFVVSLGEGELALVKEVHTDIDAKDLRMLANAIEETLKSELMVRTVIGIGTVCEHLKDLAASYKEAQVALDVGRIFESDKSVINYENLGIGRLIYQLPTTMCEMFLSEVFKKNGIDSLDRETLETIQKFFENNLNVSETSRKLFVHRNTLVYRLEKIKKLTGLDLREFDHAIIFKVALMVKQYLVSRQNKF